MNPFSNRILKIHASETLKAKLKAQELKNRGIDVISLAAGEPDFPTPAKIKEACKKALDENWTRYAPVNGLKELRQAISEKLRRVSEMECDPDQIVVTCGAKQAIYSALQVLINDGDEVLLPVPYWVSYPAQILLAGGRPVLLLTDESTGFKITPKQLEKAITKKTKLLILNSPSNPTGSCYTREEMEAIGQICRDKKIWALSDEIYEELTYDGWKHSSFLKACPEHGNRTILINGASKAYAMTGWRMGYVYASPEFIEKFKILQSQEITSIPTFIQRACLTAFRDCDKEISQMRGEFEKRRNSAYEKLTQIKGIKCFKPQGAFYFFPNVKSFGQSTSKLAEDLLEKAHVSVVAGDGFGAPGYLRLSFAAETAVLEEGIERIQKFLNGVQK